MHRAASRVLFRLCAGLLVSATTLSSTTWAADHRLADRWSTEPPHTPAESQRSARDYYYEGEARYSAADYVGAIESFTQALAAVTKDGATPRMRSSLLLNLAGAHVKAYEATQSRHHLVAADEIYTRLAKEAEDTAFPDEHVAEAKAHGERIKAMLEVDVQRRADAVGSDDSSSEHQARETTYREKSTTSSSSSSSDTKAAARPWAKTMTIAGSVVLAAGGGVLVYGAMLRPLAKKRAREEGRTDTQAQAYVADWTRRGRIAMATGAGVAVVGAAALTTGLVFLVRGRSENESRNTSWLPLLGPSFVGAQLSVRY